MRLRVTSILQGLIFYGLLLVIALTAIPYGTVEPWWVAVFECFVFILGSVAIIEAFVDPTPRPSNLALALPLLALTLFILWQSVSVVSARDAAGVFSMDMSLSADPYGSRLVAVKLFAFIVVGALLLRYASTKGRLRTLVVAVIAIGAASALFGLLRRNLQTAPGFFLAHLVIDRNSFGQFINKNHFAFLMEMTLGLVSGLLLTRARNPVRLILLFVFAALVWAALITSNSRGGILGSLCELLFLGVLLDPIGRLARRGADPKRKSWQRTAGSFALRGFLIVFLVVLFGYGVAWIGGEPVVNNFATAETDFGQSGALNNANTSRKQMWSMTWNMFRDHPVAGIGFGAYWIAVTKHHNASGELTPQQAHNDYLDLLAAGGLVGCALVLWFTVTFLKQARFGLRSTDPFRRAACLGALTGIFGVAIHSFVDFGLHITINALVLVILIVIATAKIGSDESKVSPSL